MPVSLSYLVCQERASGVFLSTRVRSFNAFSLSSARGERSGHVGVGEVYVRW